MLELLTRLLSTKSNLILGVRPTVPREVKVISREVEVYISIPFTGLYLTSSIGSNKIVYFNNILWLPRKTKNVHSYIESTFIYNPNIEKVLNSTDITEKKIARMILEYVGDIATRTRYVGFKYKMDIATRCIISVVGDIRICNKMRIPGSRYYIAELLDDVSQYIFQSEDIVWVAINNKEDILPAVTLHRMLNGYRSYTEEQYYISRRYLEENIMHNIYMYTPITVTYLELMSEITRYQKNIVIDPKYDGVPIWLYISKICPIMCYQQKKVDDGVEFNICGRIADLYIPVDYPIEEIAILAELVGNRIYIIDCYYGSKDEHIHRRDTLKKLYNDILCSIPIISIANSKYYYMDKSKKNNLDLPSIMGKIEKNTDGFVFYIGNNRPLKLKTVDNLTVDLEYNTESKTWSYEDIVSTIPKELEPEEGEEDIVVYEVRLLDGKVIRKRKDRESGNPPNLVKSILGKLRISKMTDRLNVWACKDVQFAIVANRMFKRVVYQKYIPEGSFIIDFGSGHGGDMVIWEERDYRVIAVEKDRKRYEILLGRVESKSRILCYNCDMEHFSLDISMRQYKYCTFMRSINAINNKEKKNLLSRLFKYNKIVVIVCIVEENICEDSIFEGSTGSVKVKRIGRDLEVRYSIKGEEDRVYTNYIMSRAEWYSIAEKHNYAVEEYKVEEFLIDVYGTSSMDVMRLCKLDTCMVMYPQSETTT